MVVSQKIFIFEAKNSKINDTNIFLPNESSGLLENQSNVNNRLSKELESWNIENNEFIFANIYKYLPVGVEIFDQNGKMLFVNEMQLLNLRLSESDSLRSVNLFNKKVLPEFVVELLRNGEDVEYSICLDAELREKLNSNFKLDNFQNVYFFVRINVIRDEANQCRGYVLVCEDVTDTLRYAKELESAVARFRTMFNSMSIGMAIYNLDGVLLEYNPKFKDIFGVVPGRVINKSYHYIYDPNVSALKETIEKADGEAVEFSYNFDIIKKYNYYVTNKKGVINLRARIAKLTAKDGQVIGEILMVVDITEEVQKSKKLLDMQRYLELAITAGNVAVWGFDVKKNVILNIFGRVIEEDELDIPSANLKYIHPDDIDELGKMWRRILTKQTAVEHMRLRFFNPQIGEYEFVDKTMIPLLDENNECQMIVGTHHVVTEQVMQERQLKDYNDKLIMAMEVVNAYTWSADFRDGEGLPKFDTSFSKLCPHYKNVHSMRDFIKMVYRDDRRQLINSFAELSKAESGNAEIEYRADFIGNGNYEWWRSCCKITFLNNDGKMYKYLYGICFNISAQKNIQLELQHALKKAEEADSLKSAFLANMSHEIRTPLNAIVGFSNIMADIDSKNEKEEYMKIVKANSDMLIQLINDILDLAKIESGTIEYLPDYYDFAEDFDSVYQTMTQREIGTEVAFINDNKYEKCIIYSDKIRVRQVISNFLTNAIKYTQKGFIIMGYDVFGDGIEIYVQDTGKGISAEKQDRVFSRFEKLDSEVRGNGLGLSICKAISEICHGKIWFESEYGVGSTFHFRIPTEIKDIKTK